MYSGDSDKKRLPTKLKGAMQNIILTLKLATKSDKPEWG